jgi:hypothetical protein
VEDYGWIILAVTTIIAVVGWIITMVRDIKRTAVELKECVGNHSVRLSILENEFQHIDKLLAEIKALIKN